MASRQRGRWAEGVSDGGSELGWCTRLVDPDFAWWPHRDRSSSGKALRTQRKGCIQHRLSLDDALVNATEVHVRRRQHGESCVMVFVVVPVEEVDEEAACRFDFAESIGKVGPVLHRFEVRFAEWVVIGNVRARM